MLKSLSILNPKKSPVISIAALIINMLSRSGFIMSDRGSYILSTHKTITHYRYPTLILKNVNNPTELRLFVASDGCV